MKLRATINFNTGWNFTGPDGAEQPINLPHTWNNIDGQDGGNDYWRGTCVYRKQFAKSSNSANWV